uniref:Endonuclease/exonuclease/phosphatase family protein n=1 Tax=Roseihalotalea indica TaxID=2867963 RepID=A0AA49GJS5_9BACT|nr:endonuclease/exonuclease/phosphatase family protein [Tunicatimonas sp. TK19036]
MSNFPLRSYPTPIKKINRFILLSLIITTLICFISLISPYFPATYSPLIHLFTLFIPVVFILLIIAILFSLLFRQRILAIINILLLLFGVSYFEKMWAFPKECYNAQNSDFTVITFNASFFRVLKVFSEEYYDLTANPKGQELIQYVTAQSAEIICLQEFFNDVNYEPYNVISTMQANGYDYYFLKDSKHDNGIDRGIITFSKFPIIDSGRVFLSENNYNGASFIDVEYQNSILRIINVHLESMELYFGQQNIISKARYGLRQYKRASIARNYQTQELLSFIDKSPYPILLMGDFNELPISYNLQRFSDQLGSAFQQAGSGFGTTLTTTSSVIPARIDNIFLSEGINATCLTVDQSITTSDHYPVYSTVHIKD